MVAALAVDQRRGDADPTSRAAHTAFQHIAHTEFAGDGADIHRLALEGEAGVARHDEELSDAGEGSDDVLGDPVREVLLFGIARHVGKGQDRDRGLVGQRRWLVVGDDLGHRGMLRRPCPHLDLPCDIFELLSTTVLEMGVHQAAEAFIGDAGKRQAAWRTHFLESRGHVDPIAMNILAIDRDVAQIDADAEGNAFVLRHGRVAIRHADLNRQNAFDCADDAWELKQQPVAHGLDDAAAMLGDQRVNQFRPVRPERSKRTGLVGAHQARIANYVGRNDGRQSPLRAL